MKTVIAATVGVFMSTQAQDSGTPNRKPQPHNLRPLVFVITGESNSGGIGQNADASPQERATRSCVQIMNLTDGEFGFEDMRMGKNTLRDHFRLQDFYETCHGLENQLANAVEAEVFPGHEQVYLIKTGQGGSRIAEWDEQHASGYWKKFIQRTDVGKRKLPDDPQWVVWFSLGINDAIDGAPIAQWKKKTQAHLRKIKATLPDSIIVMTQFQSMHYPQVDGAIAEIVAGDDNVYAVSSAGAGLRDANHWSYAGLKTVGQRMADVTRKALVNRSPKTDD